MLGGHGRPAARAAGLRHLPLAPGPAEGRWSLHRCGLAGPESPQPSAVNSRAGAAASSFQGLPSAPGGQSPGGSFTGPSVQLHLVVASNACLPGSSEETHTRSSERDMQMYIYIYFLNQALNVLHPRRGCVSAHFHKWPQGWAFRPRGHAGRSALSSSCRSHHVPCLSSANPWVSGVVGAL